MAPRVRWILDRDMHEVAAIEQSAFDRPWEFAEIASRLRSRNTIGLAAEEREAIRAFVIYDLLPTSLRIRKLAVDRQFRRLGFGALLIDKLKAKLVVKRTRLKVQVNERNLPGLLFLQAQGFRAVQLLRDADGDGDDAIRLIYRQA